MARGWESKSIETQQEEAARPKGDGGRAPTSEEREAATRRETLELARAKVRQDLGRAKTAAHREMLQRALDDLETQLATSRGGHPSGAPGRGR